MIDLKQSFPRIASSYYGATTGSETHRRLVDLYNEIRPLPRSYRLKYTDAWCAAFVSACAYVLGIPQDVIRPECGAHEMYRAYPAGQRELHAETGDLVFYDWNNDGRIDHVGIVMYAGDGQLQVVEGNKENAVDYRFIKEDDPAIYGFIRPFYGGGAEHILYVDCDELNVRENPSMDAPVIAHLGYGTTVFAQGPDIDGWTQVQYGDEGTGAITGWCGSGYLTEDEPPLTGKTVTAVYLRAGAGTSSKILRVLPSGEELRYTGDRSLIGSSVWERVILLDGTEGWINRRFTRPDDESVSR